MKTDKAHLTEINSLLDLCYQLIVYLLVSNVTPPKKDVGLFEKLVRKALIGIVESGEGYSVTDMKWRISRVK